MGLAHSLLYWLYDYSADFCAAARCRKPTPSCSAHRLTLEDPDHYRQKLAHIGAGTLLVAMTTTTFYFITVYTPTYGRAVLHLSARDSLLVTMLVGIQLYLVTDWRGISDRIGRRPVLMGITLLALLTTWPVMHWLTAAPDFTRMTLVLLWFSFFFGMYNGAMVAAHRK
jgi:hypothetical protein